MTGRAPSGSDAWSLVRLVAAREVRTRVTTKGFRVATLLAAATLVVLAVVTSTLTGTSSSATVGVTPAEAALAVPLRTSATAVGQHVTVRTVPDAATGRAQVGSGDLDALVLDSGGDLQVVVEKKLDDGLRTALQLLAGQLALHQQVRTLGGDPARVDAAVAGARVDVQALQPPRRYHSQQLALGMIAGILIYLSLMLNGQSVAQGVVEEKSSRVVEVLLASIRPWQLMAGKVAGIGLVGLIQMVVVGVAGAAAGLGTGALSIPTSAAASTVAWLIVWYLLGFFAYALAFAAVGALVSRQEDVPGAVGPVLMFVIVGYVIGISVLPSDPGSGLVEALSIAPVFAPTLMPMRLAMGGVPAWEAAVSVGLVVALIPALVVLSARVYRNAVMRTGARIRLGDALRSGV